MSAVAVQGKYTYWKTTRAKVHKINQQWVNEILITHFIRQGFKAAVDVQWKGSLYEKFTGFLIISKQHSKD